MHYSGPEAAAITWAFTALMIIVWLLRLFTRLILARNPGWEDLCISFAALNCIGLSICIQMQVNNGMGKHAWTLSQTDGTKTLQAFYASLTLYNLALTFCKVSILLQYLRIFTVRGFRIAAYIVLTIVGIYGAWTLLSSIFVCWPIAYFWNKITIKGHCLDEFNVWFANAGMNILTDITIVVLPIRPIQHLNLPRRQKRLLIVVFGLAGFVCIVSILRLQSLVQISRSKDQSWDNGPAATWSSVEANVGIICASLPPLRPLISRIAPRIFPGTAYASPGYGYGSKTTRGEPNGRHHVPLSSASRQNAQFAPSHSKSKSRSGNRSGNHSGSNESEEEMIGLKHMGAGVAIGEPPVYSPRRVGVQPATVVATSPPISRSQSFATSPVERPGRAFHKPIPRDEMRGIVTPPGRSRRNSFDRWEQRPPEGNEIQVVTSMQQSVETQDPGRTWYDGAPHVVPSGWEMRH